ncbi:MAG TPA: hypothetical protein VFR23_16230, partial [Jiangellaceae bacterium]|nr:hypothetical protein [Jiangellaceae bacterium]
LEEAQSFDTVKLYFFNDKDYNPRDKPEPDGNTYRQPSEYTVQYHVGTDWVDVPGQVRSPGIPQANYNVVTFPEITAQRVRILMSRTGNFGIGVKEIQIFDTVDCDQTITGTHPGPLRITSGVTCLEDGATVSGPVTVESGAGLVASGALIGGQVVANGATIVHLIDSEVDGRLTVSGSTERVAVAGTSVIGLVTIIDNTTGDVPIVIADNDITGPLTCSGNQPPPTNGGLTNTTTGPKTGQCSTL